MLVPTNKPKIQIYVDADLQKRIMDFCGSEEMSQSELGASAIKAFIDNTALTISLESEILSALESWASEERRLPEQQAQLIIEKAISKYLSLKSRNISDDT